MCFALKINNSNMVVLGVSHGTESLNLLLGLWRWNCVAIAVLSNGEGFIRDSLWNPLFEVGLVTVIMPKVCQWVPAS